MRSMAASAYELTLLDRVILRVGSADTDDQLQSAVSKFLPPVLLKLSSQQDGVRKKVMELLVHINRRIKCRPLIQLPIEALLVQYQDPVADAFLINFTIIYLKMGYPRLPVEKQAELAPSVLNALEGKPQNHRDSLLLLLMPVLGNVVVPRDAQKRSALFGLDDRPQLAKELTDFMLDTLLVPYSTSPQQLEEEELLAPLGSSDYSFRRATGDSPIKPEALEQTKLGILKFISHGVIPDPDILIHLIVAAADTRFSVANAGEMELVKIARGLDWSDPSITTPLYHLFLGTKVFERKFEITENFELYREPAGTRLRIKIMTYLAKARGPAVVFPACVQVFFDSLYGTLTNLRLKTMALQFFTVDFLPSRMTTLVCVAGVVLSALLKVLPGDEDSLKGLAYSAIGKVVRHVPMLAKKDLTLLQKLFDVLSQEEADTKMCVYHALLTMMEAFCSDIEDNTRVIMQALLAKHLESEEPMARLAAVRYLQKIFPGDHAPSRYALLQVSSDPNLDVLEAANEALYSGSSPDNLILPSFIDMVNVIMEKGGLRLSGYSGYFRLQISKKVIMFLVMCAVKGAQGSMTVEEFQLPRPAKWTPLLGRYFCQLQEDDAGRKAIAGYLTLLEELSVVEFSFLPINALLDVVGSAPELLAYRLNQKLPLLKSWFPSSMAKARVAATQLYGTVLAYSLGDSEFDDAIVHLIGWVKGKNFEMQHGGILALAHAFQRRITILKKKGDTDKIAAWPAYQDGVDAIISFLDVEDPVLLGAASCSIGELARCFALPLPAGRSDLKAGKLNLVNKLQSITNNPKTATKVKEDAAMTLGLLCVGEVFPHRREVIQGLLDFGKNNDLEVQLSVGESLVCCILGAASPLARDAWCVPEEEFKAPRCPYGDEDLDWLVLELINTMAPGPRPSTKQASCLWLLALLKHCGHHAPLQHKLPALQKTFMNMLGENNDFIQDAASKGLALVYESSDEAAQNELMAELLNQLTKGRRSVLKVTNDTKLFEEGQLGTAPSGGNLSTYKELCDLVSDLNQPDLIYKFMNLANHSALWDSKKGAAFGFSAIAASAKKHLSNYFPTIVPRLYRYQYDPTPKIQRSMTNIWGALVREPKKTIEQYYNEILSDLLKNLTNPQWRVRISCCLGLSDLLRGGYNKSLHDCVEELPQMWKQLFRVMDDIHEGTRVAATNTTKVLSKLTVRSCEITQGKSGETVMKTVLPVLLEVGICNTVDEVRAISLQCVSQLVDSAGKLLHPHLAKLIPALLEATSDLELGPLGYTSGLSGDPEKEHDIDSLRASAAKSHYAMETVTKCVKYIDAATLEGLVPSIIELIRSSASFGTRITCTHLIVLLAQHLKLELRPHAGKLLTALVNGLTDPNAVLRKHYGSTMGYLAPIAKDSSVEKLMTKLRSLCFQKEDSLRFAAASAFQVIARHNPELLQEYSSVVFPVIFLGMHLLNAYDSTGDVWKDIWSDTTPGTEAGILQNFSAICSAIKEALDVPSWCIKAGGARALVTVASQAASSLDSSRRRELVSLLINSLSGRSWIGKESLLLAIKGLVNSCKDALKQEDCSALVDAVLGQCSKDRVHYQQSALQAMGDILETLEYNRFNEVYAIAQDVLSRERPPPDGDLDTVRICEIAYLTLGKSWPVDENTQVMYREKLLEECVTCLNTSTHCVQLAVMSALRRYVDRLMLLQPSTQLDDEEQESLNKIVTLLRTALYYTLSVARHTNLKTETLNVLYLLVKKLKDAQQDANVMTLGEVFQVYLEEASEDNAQEIKSRAMDIKQLLKP